MTWRNLYVKRFIHHVPKTALLKAAIEAGFDLPAEITKKELQYLWHGVLKYE